MTPEILYEDNHLLVCVKPVGILSQGDHTGDPDMLTLLQDYLREKYQKPGNVFVGLIHRLDRMVGGVMVFARTSKAASRLSEQVRNRTFQKTYQAVVTGIPKALSGTFRDFLLKNEKTNMVTVVPENTTGAKEAVLDYQVVSTKNMEGKTYSLVEIRLHTGRPHQIRVQFASRNLPLAGDHRYGNPPKVQNTVSIPSVALWSAQVKFQHPTQKVPLIFRQNPSGETLPWNWFFT